MAKAKEYWPYVKEFFFDDDTFNLQKARTVELCAKLKPLGLTWSCTSRVTTDFETLKAMREAGCRLLIVGFESGDPQILKNIKKVDEGGHQMAQIQYPGLPADDLMEAVHHFYDEYYFRPKAAFRILYKAAWTSADRKRLYNEAKSFLKLRAQRNKWVR